ncbi:MAG: ATP-binding cassette domain-containing protein [Methanospirillum sp.]|nr:ATP-binding cassette domain-containing protein [Methanospirillum sp.]
MTGIILEARDLRYRYPRGDEVVRGISFHIRRGEKIAIVGPNGAGKSTLLMMFNGILRPSSGTMLYDNQPIIYDTKSLRSLRKSVGFVLQNPDQQIVAPTVYQDVGFGPANLGASEEEVKRAVQEALRAVGLEGFEHRPTHQLSGGEKKKVAIAGVLAMEPEVLVFDEPTSSLDPAASAEIMELLDELNDQGTTIIVSTHDIELANLWADRAILMVGGWILQEDVPSVAFGDPDLVRAARLTTPVLLELHHELGRRGIPVPAERPRSVLEMLDAIDRAFQQDPHRAHPGTITVYDADAPCDGGLARWRALRPEVAIGAMGTRAKQRAAEEGVPLHFTYGVVDKCILKALLGEDALILTTGGMIRRVFERVEEYARQSGVEIPVVLIGGE